MSMRHCHIIDQNSNCTKNFFFSNQILHISSSPDEVGTIVWPLLIINLLSWTILFLCVIRGVKSVGKVVYFSATFPYLILSILFIRGITLPGAWDGIKFYIVPQWEKLLNLEVSSTFRFMKILC